MSDTEGETLRSTFPSYMAEGERLYLCGEFSKAAQSFSNALYLQDGDKNCLVARSKCFLKMGDLERSLKDAEASLQSDPAFCRCLSLCPLYSNLDLQPRTLLFHHIDLPDAKSRALDNIGRVFARVGKFQQAIDTWEEKIPLAKTTLEKTWLFHEIGRCYLELDQAWQAQNYGEKSQQCAKEEGDIEWQLNASVLVAQAQVKLRDFESAVNNFEKALERAKLVHNNEAQQAIISALDDANKGIIGELRKTNYMENLKEKSEGEASLYEDRIITREKDMRRVRDEPEKVVKQWDHIEDEKETDEDNEAFGEALQSPASGKQSVEAGKARSDLGAVAKGLSGELGTRSGETGGKLLEAGRRESREIYRRPSGELEQRLSGEFSRQEPEELKKLSEVGRREPEELGKTQFGEIGETKKTGNEMEKEYE
ncbi:TTC25 isoform 3 [Pan troglodytes]|uniref:Outer dynein arm-docking complex subunit 4 n=1 Tax=Pan troglodytes TaxID=9598 RepID=A0A2J8KG27_PANTR|nr:TTC25 isoform 3 [Pan troglodytes]